MRLGGQASDLETRTVIVPSCVKFDCDRARGDERPHNPRAQYIKNPDVGLGIIKIALRLKPAIVLFLVLVRGNPSGHQAMPWLGITDRFE